MQTIDYLANIINSHYLSDDMVMVEPACGALPEQRVEVRNISRNITGMKLYQFSRQDKEDAAHLPFFNKNGDGDNKAPNGLNKFCDYILLVQHTDGLYVFLLEMKRGTNEGAKIQLEASKCFFDYILQSADRIKGQNCWTNLNTQNVYYRRIEIKEEHSNKKTTKPNDIENMDMDDFIQHRCSDVFKPIYYCK